MIKQNILDKAKRTEYKHKAWFSEGGKSVYDAIKYYVDSGDFYIDTTIKCYEQLPKEFFKEWLTTTKAEPTKRDITDWLIKNKTYDKLVIRYNGNEGGSDKGKLKLQTYFALKGWEI